MPRVIDFTQGNETDWNEVRLPEVLYGEREIRAEEIHAIADAFNHPVGGFWPQFSTYGMSVDRMRKGDLFDAAHAWLSANVTGPWLWTETWTNHGHHLDVHVYVERVPDQEAFAAAHRELFKYLPAEDSHVARLAVERGVLPPLTVEQSFSAWTDAHRGFEFLKSDDLGNDGYRVVFTHPEIEKRFVERWGDQFAIEEKDGRRVYSGVTASRSFRDSPAVWFDRNMGVSSPSGGPTAEGYRWKVEARYDDVADALERDWGHVFTRQENGSSFEAEDLPSPAGREIPADFLAYLRGVAEGFEAPHLPEELQAFRHSEIMRSMHATFDDQNLMSRPGP